METKPYVVLQKEWVKANGIRVGTIIGIKERTIGVYQYGTVVDIEDDCIQIDTGDEIMLCAYTDLHPITDNFELELIELLVQDLEGYPLLWLTNAIIKLHNEYK